jgi:3-dehydroquinate dehydratase-1
MALQIPPRAVVRVRGLDIGTGIPKIIVPLVGKTEAELVAQARVAREEPGVDAVEWRVDFYEGADGEERVLNTLSAIRAALGELPLLFTFRTRKEGGARPIPKERYYALNQAAARSGRAVLIDVEIFTAEDVPHHIAALHGYGVKVIGSKHDFDGTPPEGELISFLEKGWEVGADLPKLAVMPRNEEDVRRLLDVTRQMQATHRRPLITMSMSELGVSSRTCGERYGSAMTFGALGQSSAPGQLSVAELRRALEREHAALTQP